jgi:hypothetical protein
MTPANDYLGIQRERNGNDFPSIASRCFLLRAFRMNFKDGSALILKTYVHLQDEHSLESAKRVK